VTVRRLNRYEVREIQWLSGIENFVSERDDFIFNSSTRLFTAVDRLIPVAASHIWNCLPLHVTAAPPTNF